jgi:hypothetical protein
MNSELFAELEAKCQKIMQRLGCKDYDSCIEKLKQIEQGCTKNASKQDMEKNNLGRD